MSYEAEDSCHIRRRLTGCHVVSARAHTEWGRRSTGGISSGARAGFPPPRHHPSYPPGLPLNLLTCKSKSLRIYPLSQKTRKGVFSVFSIVQMIQTLNP
jgi:hypothetical protein